MTFKSISKQLERTIRKGYGSPCKQFNIGCASCQMHLALDIVKDAAATEVWWRKQKKK